MYRLEDEARDAKVANVKIVVVGATVGAGIVALDQHLVLPQDIGRVHLAALQLLVGVGDETVILAAADRGLGDQLGIFPVDELANGLDVGRGHSRNPNLSSQ